jgi:hypothetical protein
MKIVQNCCFNCADKIGKADEKGSCERLFCRRAPRRLTAKSSKLRVYAMLKNIVLAATGLVNILAGGVP